MKRACLLATIFVAANIASYFLGYTPLVVTVLLILMSAITYVYYARDKAAAIADNWRVPENTLHLLSLIGGWPGGLIARHHLRHKTKKTSFRIVFWLTVIMNITAFIWLHSPKGNNLLRNGVFQLENAALTHIPSSNMITAILWLTDYQERSFIDNLD